MILGDREQVYENIRAAVKRKDFNAKVEPMDPKLGKEDKERILRRYLEYRNTFGYRVKRKIAQAAFSMGTSAVGLITQVSGLENLAGLHGPAIITCNHFSPLDPVIIRYSMKKAGLKRICIVNQDTNLAMKGVIGYMQRYADTMPVSSIRWFMEKEFPAQIKSALDNNSYVLIYPEQEMWFNYRKPRPLKRGAYMYAVRFAVPIIPLFVEQIESGSYRNGRKKISYRLHILPVIYPPTGMNERSSSIVMMQKDYEQKCRAYSDAYGKKLVYDFEKGDVAGR
ncbi:MAG: lysophospholipid acyltransferase family protein [Lachnospira sp.]|nr:lysophospholipid acyltransferase family protein [Lachnospira sp.]